MRLVSVAVPVPAIGALTYGVPDKLPEPVVGARVLVPVGSRVVTGVVIASVSSVFSVSSASSPEPPVPGPQIRDIIDVLDEAAFLPSDVIALVQWVAEYYACGVGEALAAAMPPRAWVESERHAQVTDAGTLAIAREKGMRAEILQALRSGKPKRVDALATRSGIYAALVGLERDGLVEISRPLQGRASAFRMVRVASLTAQGYEELPTPTRQREAIELLRGAPQGLDTSDLSARGISPATLKRLMELGLINISRRTVDRDPFEQAAAKQVTPRVDVALTDEQASAFKRLKDWVGAEGFTTALVHGVTGSGKTEIYLRLAKVVQASGRDVLLLVPEIALTPSVAALFRGTFGDRVAIQHSGLSDGERHDQWHRIRRGDVDVVVGTRSAVFAPVTALGLIVVDEEHDSSYKQEESPRYHGRDVAVMRARQAGALVVLGSATPSLESFHNAQTGRYQLVSLARRVLDRPLADVRIVDMRAEYAANGPDVILSSFLVGALGSRLERGEQAIVLLNRRGFATVMFCRECAHTLECPNCSVSLTVHKAIRRARCHYCNYSMTLPAACVKCSGTYLEQAGFGTERVESEIAGMFPSARVARVDRDTIRRRGAISGLLGRFAAGDLDVLVGTQMLAKGHDFPRVTLVGVISADVGLGLADFRAGERTFQLLTQVAGRAGRGQVPGEAIIQTLYPNHYSIRHACRQDYHAFFADELEYRQRMKYPPAVALINSVVKARTREDALADAGEIVRALRWGGEPYRVLGPAPAPLGRLKGEYRAQFFMKGTQRAPMRKALMTALENRTEIRRRTTVDIDPMSVL